MKKNLGLVALVVVLGVAFVLLSNIPQSLITKVWGVLFGHVPSAYAVDGFSDTVIASSLDQPAVIAAAPDGRIFVGEKSSGKVKIIKNGGLLSEPMLDVNNFIPIGMYFDSYFERGLLGIAFHPDFLTDATKQFIYIYYTVCTSPNPSGTPGTSTGCNANAAKNRVARFKVAGDSIDTTAGQTVIIDNIPSPAGNHNGGWIGFGQDQKLYISVGDGGGVANRVNAQKLNSLNGKVLRINEDGTVPSDNPTASEMGYVDPALNPAGTVKRPEIWAMGFRNPWRCRWHSDGRFFCGDVGESSQEELDVVSRGKNYGWPFAEGSICPTPSYTTCPSGLTVPIYSYGRSVGGSITVGDFGSKTNFSGDYQQSFFVGDYVGTWIGRLVLDASGTAVIGELQDFMNPVGSITDLIVGLDGNIYYTDIAAGTIHKISLLTSTNRSPVIVASASPNQGPAPLAVQFSSVGTVDPDGDPLTYNWSFGDGATSTEANPAHTYTGPDGVYTAVLTVSDGNTNPGPSVSTLEIQVGRPPVLTLSEPLDGSLFTAGQTINVTGSASDPDDGALPASALHWKVVFHHKTHTHPFIDDLIGSPQSFVTDSSGEMDTDISYEIILSAADSSGLVTTKSVTILPQVVSFTLDTSPSGLQVTLDGSLATAPFTANGVSGFPRIIGTPSPQTKDSKQYAFQSWSDGGAQTHTMLTQAGTVVGTFLEVVDTTAPAAITSLNAKLVFKDYANLRWTAPGDDGTTGTAAVYDIRYAKSPITEANWGSALQAAGEPAPQSGGTAETYRLGGLQRKTKYYVAIKTSDESGNISPISNVLIITTK